MALITEEQVQQLLQAIDETVIEPAPDISYHYAQLNDDGICVADSFLSQEIDDPNMILLPDDMKNSILGKKYVDGEWVDVPKPDVPEPIDQKELLLNRIAVTDEYLACLAEISLL